MERGIAYALESPVALSEQQLNELLPLLHDRMTETVLPGNTDVGRLFATHEPAALQCVELLEKGKPALEHANAVLGLALSADEIEYLEQVFVEALQGIQ